MKILILGATGMLGHTVFRYISQHHSDVNVYGTTRSDNAARYFSASLIAKLIYGVDTNNIDSLVKTFADIKPDIVINCIGLVKQLSDINDPLISIPINSLLPHRLARICKAIDARLIHISTDCVFAGTQGYYSENDFPDACDLYGRSKFLGEVDYPHAITLRTSIIGHELSGQRSLLEWFLAQQNATKGFAKAIFSGIPTVELANIITNCVIPKPELTGLYHVAAAPINKFDLLQLIAKVYKKDINIIPTDELVIDRSLNSGRFNKATGYIAPSWPELIRRMYEFQ